MTDDATRQNKTQDTQPVKDGRMFGVPWNFDASWGYNHRNHLGSMKEWSYHLVTIIKITRWNHLEARYKSSLLNFQNIHACDSNLPYAAVPCILSCDPSWHWGRMTYNHLMMVIHPGTLQLSQLELPWPHPKLIDLRTAISRQIWDGPWLILQRPQKYQGSQRDQLQFEYLESET